MYLRKTVNGKKVIEKINNVLFDFECDVCVAGLGTAGSFAAIYAAKMGLDVIGIEKNKIMGGVATAGCVCDYYCGIFSKMSEKINQKCVQLQDGTFYATANGDGFASHPPDVKAYVLKEEAEKYGCKLVFDTVITGVYTSDGKIAGIEALSDKRIIRIKAKIFIDCADLSLFEIAGCEINDGRKSDKKTLRFSNAVCAENDKHMKGAWSFGGYIDLYDNKDYTKKILETAASSPSLKDEYFSHSRLHAVSSMLGLREVSTAQTLERYTLNDFLVGKKIQNPVCYAFATVDNSNPDIEKEDEDVQDWLYLAYMHRYGIHVLVPMGALMSNEYSNLLVAGKTIGVGHGLAAATRMKADVEKYGIAAAIIAKEAVEKNLSIYDVEYDSIKDKLIHEKCIDESRDLSMRDMRFTDKDGEYVKAILPKTSKEYKKILSSQCPELALCAAKLGLSDEIRSDLKKHLAESDITLRQNSIIALYLDGKTDVKEYILGILKENPVVMVDIRGRPDLYPWFAKSITSNFLKAVMILGRIGDVSDIALLEDILIRADDIATQMENKTNLNLKNCWMNQIKDFTKESIKNINLRQGVKENEKKVI